MGGGKMHTFFMITEDAGIDFNCLVQGYSGQEKIILKHLRQGDCIEVTNNGRYVMERGWFISVTINEAEHVYLALEDLETSLKKKQMMTLADVMIKLREWDHQLNVALDQKDRDWFKFVSRKLLKLQTILS
jgi:hypothetical protein